eukprot:4697689-Amphidinium_carterae.1
MCTCKSAPLVTISARQPPSPLPLRTATPHVFFRFHLHYHAYVPLFFRFNLSVESDRSPPAR